MAPNGCHDGSHLECAHPGQMPLLLQLTGCCCWSYCVGLDVYCECGKEVFRTNLAWLFWSRLFVFFSDVCAHKSTRGKSPGQLCQGKTFSLYLLKMASIVLFRAFWSRLLELCLEPVPIWDLVSGCSIWSHSPDMSCSPCNINICYHNYRIEMYYYSLC